MSCFARINHIFKEEKEEDINENNLFDLDLELICVFSNENGPRRHQLLIHFSLKYDPFL
jgi:hypothetical protein